MIRIFVTTGAFFGFLAVAAGAFGAHGLKARLTPDALSTFEIGARYQMYHALALILVAWAVDRFPGSGAITGAGICFIVGTLVFSGSLYLLAWSGTKWLGAVTPIGGLVLLAGWVCLAVGAWRG